MEAHVTPGQTVQGTENAAAYGTRVSLAATTRRSCGIAIANCTDHKLVNPKLYVYAGSILGRPVEIKPDTTGLITAQKIYGSTWGAVGLISYAIEETDKRLQIYYDVPMQRLLFDVKANVMVGFKTASQDLFFDMRQGTHGELTLARSTMCTKKDISGYDIEFLMEDLPKSSLTVVLRHHTTEVRNPKKHSR